MFLTCAGVDNTFTDSHFSFGPLKSFEVLTIFNTEFQENILSKEQKKLFFSERLVIRNFFVFGFLVCFFSIQRVEGKKKNTALMTNFYFCFLGEE